MPARNVEIAEVLFRLADLLEIQGANPFRVRAYRGAARIVGSLARPVSEMIDAGEDLTELPGVGADLAGKIGEIARTGDLALLHEVETQTPPELVELLSVPGLGPKRVARLFAELGIRSLDALAEAVRDGRIATMKGFGPQTQARILEAWARRGPPEHRTAWWTADGTVAALLAWMRGAPGIERVEAAGSYRRRRETVGNLDVLASSGDSLPVTDHFVHFEEVREVPVRGPTRVTVRLRSGLQVDLRVVPPESWGAALHYFTGSKGHNIAVRRRGMDRGLKINEYGVFADGVRIGGETEEQVFAAVGLPWIPPELHEDRGELEAAEAGTLPRLVELGDIRGDLHSHTTRTDGRDGLAAMAAAARGRGLAYLANTEHTKTTRIARGLDGNALLAHLEAVDAVNATFDDFRVLRSAEVDILEDGTLDLPDSVLARLDLAVCSVHHRGGLDREAMTRRIVRAMDNPFVDVIGHPTGRLLGRRAPYDVDMEQIMHKAARVGCMLEMNAQPGRMDLDDTLARRAREIGVRLVVSTDAHAVGELDFMRLGVGLARRAWLRAEDVANTREWADLRRLLRRSRVLVG